MRHSLNRIAYLACACLALFAALTAHGAEPTQVPVEAVWRAQRLTFHYRSEGTMYTCGILEGKIKMILRELGAREPLQLRRVYCRDFDNLAQLEVLMESPVVATAENIRDVTNYDSKDELIARVSGVSLPSAEDLERFTAVWEPISFRDRRKFYLADNDCALVQQLRRQILPNMSIQVVKDIERLDCSHATTPRFKALALVATGENEHAAVDPVQSHP